MQGKIRWLAIGVFVLLAGTLSGCGCACVDENRPGVLKPEGLKLEGAKPVTVGTLLELEVSFVWDSDYRPTEQEEDLARMGLKWSVQPTDGARVDGGGSFEATKPGVYTVTVSMPDSSLAASAEIQVTEATEKTDTSTETTEETETTSTTAGNTFAGTYAGSWLWTAGQSRADVPWAFTVDDQGTLNGGFDTMLSADTRVVCVLTGQVSDDGMVDASGRADATVTGAGSNSTPMTLTGQIAADGTFTGKLAGAGGQAVDVTAKRR